MEENNNIHDLSFFMPNNVLEVETEEVPISKRFVDGEGKIVPFTMKPITTERIDQLEKLNTDRTKVKGRVQERVDYPRFIAHVALESTVYPNFKSEELRNAYNSQDPIEVAKKVLHVGGEYTNWISKASEINGFDDTVEELEDAIKNS